MPICVDPEVVNIAIDCTCSWDYHACPYVLNGPADPDPH